MMDAVSVAYAAAPQETSVEASTATIGAHAPPLATTIDTAISSEPSLLEALPDDLLQAILLACPTSTVLVLTATCRRLRVAGEYDGLWVSKVRCRYERILPLFAKGPWMPLPSPEDVPCLVRGESPKRFYFSFGPSWMKLAAQGAEVGMGPAPGYCVMVIDGRVYDLTAFVDEHPGEPYLLRAAAGTDASEAFDFIGHSNHARSVLRGYARPDLELLEEEPRLDDARRLLLGSASLRPTVTVTAADSDSGVHGYDRVLVDAECTHDGSIKHLAKFAQWGWETFERRFLDTERLTSLTTLQAALLAAGFRALKPGGTLVYSTCSFARAQNEAIVEAFVRAEPRAELVPIESLRGAPCRAGDVPHTLRFEPRISQTSGLFVAKLTKLAGVG
ncbi:s-adenosyl-l-methionine-dependent methyltransferase domain-containing protein [Chrysochromulina tobinii]|uniref:S-adenosyl-l-methionine-dependent methyltransferase domain-containing protein n=1 Tax=Chrysochromulina tobinii TaxID=1460289 RepID=A0A0M0JN85_9EUKA|nr:s-adenosyl-l-methionine-dependent methyltransferase domain-containing protein [Chrysochromulina tobinii]|eukprot:KOO28034.1 s-adenosyl-l-methionine-dependent methyltransferase domain-containing protein [Chrysochromulina sp. CCMP291]